MTKDGKQDTLIACNLPPWERRPEAIAIPEDYQVVLHSRSGTAMFPIWSSNCRGETCQYITEGCGGHE